MKRIDPGLVTILVSLLIIAGGFGIGHLTNAVRPRDIWISFAAAAVLITLTVFAGVGYLLPMLREELTKRNKEIEGTVRNAVSVMEERFREIEERLDIARPFEDQEWLLTTRELVSREAEVPQREVWIVSSYLGGELKEDLFAPTIRSNTDRGITYYYVIPDDPQTEARIRTIRGMVEQKHLIKAICLPERHLFNLLSAHDTCVFDPFERGENACTGYMNVDTSVADNDYFIRLGPQYCQRLVATVKHLGLPIHLDT